MTRFVSPPKNELNKLRTQLELGEKRVFEFFDTHLDEKWEIYVQPHLNGLRPDFVLLHPNAGIAVFEVKDWNLDAIDYTIECKNGKPPILMGQDYKKKFSNQRNNPIEKVYRYEQEIFNLYCPRLDRKFGLAAITAGVIFPFADDERVENLFFRSRQFRGMLQYEKYYPITGRNALESGNLSMVFPEGIRNSSSYMTPDLAKDMRNWLVEPDFSATQRTPLELDTIQMNYVTTRTKSGYRRIKGAAGSGKSIVLAARAAQLLSEHKNVLVITYNITLINYLKDLAVRWPHGDTKIRNGITWLNFHSWCKRVCQECGFEEEYKDIWRKNSNEFEIQTNDDTNDTLAELTKLVGSIIDNDKEDIVQSYDAILVDEGQDLLPEWWNVLRKFCKKNGEMLLVADATQDIYGTAKSWTDQAMLGAGFIGPWAELKVSHRMPLKLTNYARDFAKRFIPSEFANIPYSPKLDTYHPCKLRWVQTNKDRAVNVCQKEILAMAPSADPTSLAIADITFLARTHKIGHKVVSNINDKGMKFIHTFSDDKKESRSMKICFYMGDARNKGTTLHSFKGWESRSLVIYIGHSNTPKDMALAYSGITRLKSHGDGSFLTIVSSIKELEEYGRTWPEFECIL